MEQEIGSYDVIFLFSGVYFYKAYHIIVAELKALEPPTMKIVWGKKGHILGKKITFNSTTPLL